MAHLWQPFGLLLDVGLLCEINQVDDRLCCDELHGVQEIHVLQIPLTEPAQEALLYLKSV